MGKRNGRINISNTKRKYCRYYPEEDHLPGAGAGTEDCGTGSGKGIKTSRAPIREALRQLENEELIEYVRNAGCSVKEITLEESFEIYLMRANYETMAVKLMGGNVPEDTICRMEEVLEK